MIEWLTDTLVATGTLMALVLLVRRPVARWFGPGAAYALWALPMIRLVLPPLALPRGLLPEISFGVEPVTASAASSATVLADATPAGVVTAAPLAEPLAAMPSAAFAGPVDPSLLEQVPWGTLGLSVWLAGAALFLVWRTVTYRMMRRDLLSGARLVARSGAVRIVETPAIRAPLAFGVFDKVVALPQGFLADADSETSDFAIAHEMEHHAGSDLLALIAMQPLFALHWFNPIGWVGWRAVRADQEAACDARVMAGRSRAERARYGQLIASLAQGTRLGLAAPMAGPLSGEKPIIQRLKALAAADVSPARRVLARGLFAMAIVTVPATATVSYAAMDEAEVPEPPVLPSAPNALLAPAAIGTPAPDDLPEPPAPPPPPEPPAVPEWAEGQEPVPPVPPVPPAPPAMPASATRVMIHKTAIRQAAEQARDAERLSADAHRRAAEAMARAPQVEETVSPDGKRRTVRIVRREPNGQATVMQNMMLDEGCPADSHRREARSEANGSKALVVICTGEPKDARLAAVRALRTARASIASDRSLDAGVRAEILADLDREIAEARKEADGG